VTDKISFVPLTGAKEAGMPGRTSPKVNPKNELDKINLEVREKVQEKLTRLKNEFDKKNLEVRESLEERLNRLNALWEQIEEKLIALQTPRQVSVVYDSQTNPETGEIIHSMLGLAKIGGNWRLCHDFLHDSDPFESNWKPITDCSAEIRVEAAQHVTKLKEEIIRTAEEFLPKIDNAIASLDKMLSDI
jgi:hypothetical protein